MHKTCVAVNASFIRCVVAAIGASIGHAIGRLDGYWTTRGYANSRIANSRTGQRADWTTRGLADTAKKEN